MIAQPIQEYVSLETLLERKCRIYQTQYEIIRLEETYIVKLSANGVPVDKLRVNIWFRHGKYQHINVDARQLTIAESRRIWALLELAENIIQRHEYHETRKAEGDVC